MNINLDDILNEIKNNNKIKGEKCMICHMNDLKTNLLKLKCNHYFHSNCLNTNSKNNGKTIKCLYCDKKTIFKNKINNDNKNLCNVILKSGKNKGKECGRKNCHYHKN